MIVIAIDPGVAECATAWARADELRGVDSVAWGGIHKVPLPPGLGPGSTILVERPEYQGARSDAARIQDLIALAWAGARLAYHVAGFTGAQVREYTPTEWKRSEQKPPQHLRLWEDCLTPAERKLFPGDTGKRIVTAATKCALKPGRPGADYYGRGKGSEVHNLLDAAAFVLSYIGRFR